MGACPSIYFKQYGLRRSTAVYDEMMSYFAIPSHSAAKTNQEVTRSPMAYLEEYFFCFKDNNNYYSCN